ncbi:MAG TPA: AI-2E family transporter [Planctomycetes bacterium]|jgi:predicted PurR-regulated permease PerM|nr:AI-2E family transporter [Planctomycetota bacterium]
MRTANLVRALVVLFSLWLIWVLRKVTVPLLGAYLFMLVLQPLQRRLTQKLPNSVAALCCVLVLLIVPIVAFLPAAFDFQHLLSKVPINDLGGFSTQLRMQFIEWHASLPSWISEMFDPDVFEPQKFIEATGNQIRSAGSGLVIFFGGVFGIISSMVLLPIFLFFLLQGGPWLLRIRRELPASWHPPFDRILPQIEAISTNYLVARVKVAVVKMIITWVVLIILGFPGAYSLAVAVGALSLLPVLGPLVGFLLLAIVGFADGGIVGGGVSGFVVAGVIYVVLEVVEAYVLIPRFVGKGLGLSDFAVILTILCGGALLGILGLVLAVPVVAVSRVLYAEFVRPVMKEGKPVIDEAS